MEARAARQRIDDEDDQADLLRLLCDLRVRGRHLYVLHEACHRLYVRDEDLYDHRRRANPSSQVVASLVRKHE